MLQGDVGIAHPHKGVQVGAAQISVDEDHLFSQAGQADPQAQGDQAFADAPLAAPDAPELDFTSRQCLPLGGCPSLNWNPLYLSREAGSGPKPPGYLVARTSRQVVDGARPLRYALLSRKKAR